MRILVVEDEHRIATSIKKGLEQEKYAVDVAFDGETGLDMALSEEFDVLILDRMLPGMDGLEICKVLRREGVHTPVLMLTARGSVSDKVDGLDNGADDYMTKPFSFEELLARLRALTRRPKTELNLKLVVGDLEIDPSSYEVKVGNKPVNLSSKEYSVLEYLARNAGKTVTKEKLINHVWNYDADILPNTVEATIKNLRRKIGEKLISTVRGFGYKLDKGNV